ncbi:hypothetical protein NDU88_003305 [Pleurodeles waltl]|uniref:Uncharacterized protein n=1 Tax=Pleurodeles waltl TaxID=8319 RepID=A0AAV7UDP1_PLEWA|nr:hypothetical protein NDU88_003305 [Pleurodeles waltl]
MDGEGTSQGDNRNAVSQGPEEALLRTAAGTSLRPVTPGEWGRRRVLTLVLAEQGHHGARHVQSWYRLCIVFMAPNYPEVTLSISALMQKFQEEAPAKRTEELH